MKFLVLALATVLSSSAFAGTAMTVTNSALGFTYTAYPQGTVSAEICNADDKCFSFDFVKIVNHNTILYREVSKKCEVTVETFDKSFRNGQTKNEYMLDLMAFVVRVTKGENNCMLQQSGNMKQMRALTGIYL